MQSTGVQSSHREVTDDKAKKMDQAQGKKRLLQCTVNYNFKILVALPAIAAIIPLTADYWWVKSNGMISGSLTGSALVTENLKRHWGSHHPLHFFSPCSKGQKISHSRVCISPARLQEQTEVVVMQEQTEAELLFQSQQQEDGEVAVFTQKSELCVYVHLKQILISSNSSIGNRGTSWFSELTSFHCKNDTR